MPANDRILEHLKLEVGGAPASTESLNKIARIAVVHQNHAPSRFTIRLELDGSSATVFDEVNGLVTEDFKVGREIKIAYRTQQRDVLLVQGEVTSLGLRLATARPHQNVAVIVRGAHRSHRLLRKQEARTFLNVKISDIAAKVAGFHDFSIDADATAQTMAYVMQSTQTDWEFLQQLASHVGYDLYFHENTLYFKRAAARGRHELAWGRGLVEFVPQVDFATLGSTVTVTGWDPVKKQSVVGTAESSVPSASSPRGSDGLADLNELAQHAFDEGEISVGQRTIRSRAEADEVAAVVAAAASWSAVRATGRVKPGSTQILPGVVLKVTGVGELLSREYHVTSATHVMNQKQGYVTRFEAGERPAAAIPESQPVDKPNLAVGIVTNNQDPEEVGRVKVKFPGLLETESSWARVAAPMAGVDRGLYFLPEVDDEVLVAFEHGDVHAPYVVGALWNGVDSPPEKNSDGKNNIRMIRSRSGHVVRFDDTAGQEKIEIVDKSEKASIVIDSTSGNVSVNATEGDVSIEAHDITLKATNNVTIFAGKELRLKGNQSASVEGGAQAIVKARVATLEGADLVRVKGPVVEIDR